MACGAMNQGSIPCSHPSIYLLSLKSFYCHHRGHGTLPELFGMKPASCDILQKHAILCMRYNYLSFFDMKCKGNNCSSHGCVIEQHMPRVFLSLLFIVGGFGFLMNFDKTVGFVGMGLGNIGLPLSLATIALVIAIILKLGGGLMLLFNYRTSQAAWMLIIFTALATLMYHTTWSGDDGQMQMTSFLKNLAIIGGLLFFARCPCKTNTSCCTTKENNASSACCKQC